MSISGHTRATIMMRDQYACVVCGRTVINRPGSIHHRKPRGMGGTSVSENDPSNLIILCGTGTSANGCHQRVENHRGWARKYGYICRMRYAPDMVPVRYWDGRYYWLNRDGSIEQRPEPDPEEVDGDQP